MPARRPAEGRGGPAEAKVIVPVRAPVRTIRIPCGGCAGACADRRSPLVRQIVPEGCVAPARTGLRRFGIAMCGDRHGPGSRALHQPVRQGEAPFSHTSVAGCLTDARAARAYRGYDPAQLEAAGATEPQPPARTGRARESARSATTP